MDFFTVGIMNDYSGATQTFALYTDDAKGNYWVNETVNFFEN